MEDVVSMFGGPGRFLLGRFAFIFISGLVLTPIISWLVLLRYRAATRKLMGRRSKPEQPQEGGAGKGINARRPSLRMEVIEGDEVAKSSRKEGSQASKWAKRDLRATALVYVLAGGIYAFVHATIFYPIQARTESVSLANDLLLALVFFWPSIVILNLVYATSAKASLLLIGGYFTLFFAGVLVVTLLVKTPVIVSLLLGFWLLINLLPTIMAVWFMQRRLSAAVPLLFPFVVFSCAGSTLMLDGFRILTGNSSGARSAFMPVRLTGLLIFVFIAYLLLRLVGRLYLDHRFGDVEYLALSLMLPFWLIHALLLALDNLLFVIPAAFNLFIYWLVLRVGFRLNRRLYPPASEPPRYLLLRVFALGRKSELFFDSFSKLWRRTGVVTMISGPDLVSRLVEPYEFLEFLSGRLSRQFIQGEDDVEMRLTQFDFYPDPDGRYRIEAFFCYADTWQMVMQRLARLSRGILMDLRSFSANNDGCIFEIETLLDTVDLRQIVFLIDDTTDKGHLQQIINELWLAVAPSSPNVLTGTPTVRLFNLAETDARNAIPWLLDLLTV